MDTPITFELNGQSRTLTTDPQRPLLDLLREDLHLTGTHYGCGAGACGACTVLIDGKKAQACLTPAAQVHGRRVQTIEGLAAGKELHPVQEAFLAEEAFQCGYCTPGMILSTVALLQQNATPTDAQILTALSPQICRCCGYPKILSAVRRAMPIDRSKP